MELVALDDRAKDLHFLVEWGQLGLFGFVVSHKGENFNDL